MDLARVQDDYFCAFGLGPVNTIRNQRVSDRSVGTDYENAVRILYLRDRVRHGSTSESGGKTCHRSGVSKTGAVINVVGPKPHSRKFLKEIVFLIGAFGWSQKGQAISAVSVVYLFQSGGRIVEGLVPGALLESTVLADHGGRESVRAVDEFVAIPTFDAEFALIHGIGLGRESPQELSVKDFQQQLASAPAVGTSGSHEFMVHHLLLIKLRKWL
jgi:hypothetical protein